MQGPSQLSLRTASEPAAVGPKISTQTDVYRRSRRLCGCPFVLGREKPVLLLFPLTDGPPARSVRESASRVLQLACTARAPQRQAQRALVQTLGADTLARGRRLRRAAPATPQAGDGQAHSPAADSTPQSQRCARRSASRPHPRPPARAAPRRAGRPTTDWSASSTCMGSTTTPCRRRRRAAEPQENTASPPTDADDADQKYMGRARRLVRRVVAALHQGEGSPNYGMIFKQLDVCAPQPSSATTSNRGSGPYRDRRPRTGI